MFKITRLLPLAMCATVLVTATACASGPYYRARVQVVDRDDRAYYDRGFREGRSSGADDARRGRSYAKRPIENRLGGWKSPQQHKDNQEQIGRPRDEYFAWRVGGGGAFRIAGRRPEFEQQQHRPHR